MLHWIDDHQGLFWTLGIASAVMFAASLFIMPALAVRIQPDYFAHDHRPPRPWANQHPAVQLMIVIGKNVLGVILILAGIAMLLLPGQGLLTILVGFFLVDVPAKYKIEQWLMRQPVVHRPINWLRKRAHRPPLQKSA